MNLHFLKKKSFNIDFYPLSREDQIKYLENQTFRKGSLELIYVIVYHAI